jgi:hypothetical protein
MNTLFLLMYEFNSVHVPLETIAEKYLHLNRKDALQRANGNELPFPTFRATRSQKSTVMVDVRDLANWLDECRNQAKENWDKQNSEGA